MISTMHFMDAAYCRPLSVSSVCLKMWLRLALAFRVHFKQATALLAWRTAGRAVLTWRTERCQKSPLNSSEAILAIFATKY